MSRTFHIAEEQKLALMTFNTVVALKKNLTAKVALTFISGTLYGLSLPHMLDQRTVGLQFSYNLKRFS